jgi:ferredoxin
MKWINILLKAALLISLFSLIFLFIYSSFRTNDKQLQVCPVNAITMQNGRAVIDSTRCIGCGRCALGIPSPYNLTLFPAFLAKAAKNKPVSAAADSVAASVKPPVAVIVKPASADKDKDSKPNKPVQTTNIIKKIFYQVNPETCIGCTLCTQHCPVNAITMVDGKAVIDAEKCIACGVCANGHESKSSKCRGCADDNGSDFAGCPVSAISKTSK